MGLVRLLNLNVDSTPPVVTAPQKTTVKSADTATQSVASRVIKAFVSFLFGCSNDDVIVTVKVPDPSGTGNSRSVIAVAKNYGLVPTKEIQDGDRYKMTFCVPPFQLNKFTLDVKTCTKYKSKLIECTLETPS